MNQPDVKDKQKSQRVLILINLLKLEELKTNLVFIISIFKP